MFGWCYGFSIDNDAPPITKPNLITGEGRARVRGLDKAEANRKKHLRKKDQDGQTVKKEE